MKTKFLAGLAAGVFMLCFTGLAQALTMADVGAVDKLIFQTQLANSGDATELAWVNSVIGGGYIMTAKTDTPDGSGWQNITDATATYAFDLADEPDYFLVKTGNNSGNTNEWFLFDNMASVDWAVINLSGMGFSVKNIENFQKLSHIDEFGGQPVPEPATLLLLGTGLIGLAGFRKKFRKM